MDPGSPEREDFPTGTSAAAASGVTTIVEHSHGTPVRTVGDLREKTAYLRDRSNVDFGLAAHAWPGAAEVPALWAAGVTFFKVFTCTTHGVPGHDGPPRRAPDRLGAGRGGQPPALRGRVAHRGGRGAAARRGTTDGGIVPDWRSRDAELVAAVVAGLLVRRTGARATVARQPSRGRRLPDARAVAGAALNAEGCPQYFLLREDEVLDDGALRKFRRPRARTDEDEAEMWRLLRTGC